MKIEFFGVQTRLINPSDTNITEIILESLSDNDIQIQDEDIIIIASKILSIIEGGQIRLNSISQIRGEAKNMANLANLDPRFAEVVFREADEVIGAVPGAILALKNNILQANAGVDRSNAGGDEFLIILPKNPIRSANRIRKSICSKTNKKVGVIIADSKTLPLRRGTSGFALAISGFIPIIDDRGSSDLYGRSMVITTRAIADNIVCGAEILMGESRQRIPIVIARGCKDITFYDDSTADNRNESMKICPEHCLYFGPLWYNRKTKMK
jgi:coenzyme F420-0:L-glutamate ligase